jgi:hypothetical protein
MKLQNQDQNMNLSKESIIERLLENKQITVREAMELIGENVKGFQKFESYKSPVLPKREKVPYFTLCSCNPMNGGSGVCGCTMGNSMVYPPTDFFDSNDPNYLKKQIDEISFNNMNDLINYILIKK